MLEVGDGISVEGAACQAGNGRIDISHLVSQCLFRTYKLNRAAELLKSGKYTVSEISDKCGFSTQSHFSVVFKKHFGVTPSESCLVLIVLNDVAKITILDEIWQLICIMVAE